MEAFLYGADPSGSAAPVPAKEGEKRKPRFTTIVEGANLFITQDARLAIERKGVLLFKDASANKGGVTSSSLEVLAALTLNEEEFNTHMCVVSDGAVPEFYAAYVREVQAAITTNAELEFECLWREHGRTGEPISVLSDRLSVKITSLSTSIESSDSLWDNAALRNAVLREAIPKSLAELVGGAEVAASRLPLNYQRALFGSRLASRFVYEVGLNAPEYSFFEHVARVMSGGGKAGGAAAANGK